MNIIYKLAPYRKAVVAFIIGVLQFTMVYVSLAANGLSSEDINVMIGTVIVALGGTSAVYATKNKLEQ